MAFKNEIFDIFDEAAKLCKCEELLILKDDLNLLVPVGDNSDPHDFTPRCPRLCSKCGISGQIFLAQYKGEGEGEGISRTNLVRNGKNCKIAWREWQTTKRFHN